MANLRNAIALLSLVAVITAEAPYNLPRPGPGQPGFNLPGQPFNPNSGYNYQQPGQPFRESGFGLGGNFGQSGIGGSFGQTGIGGNFGQSGIGGSFGQPGIGAVGGNFGRGITPPATSYGLPQLGNPQAFRPAGIPPPLPGQPGFGAGVGTFGQQGQFGAGGSTFGQQGQFGAGGSNFGQQGQFGSGQFQSAFGGQSGFGLGSQQQQFLNRPGQINGFSGSFQSGGFSQGLGGALDGNVVNKVQNIVTEIEQNRAREFGYPSLVQGVQFGPPRPGIEVAAFVENGPVEPFINGQSGFSNGGFGSTGFGTSGFGPGNLGGRGIGGPGGLSGSSFTGGSSQGLGFLPDRRPATTYGAPVKK